mmetsp:Transcript_11627/g.21504  ORF Transcript_11627/g.21504 Transcript_11627/m.21504 type:complete len:260 (+) Transcript_11627:2925-3704(+)
MPVLPLINKKYHAGGRRAFPRTLTAYRPPRLSSGVSNSGRTSPRPTLYGNFPRGSTRWKNNTTIPTRMTRMQKQQRPALPVACSVPICSRTFWTIWKMSTLHMAVSPLPVIYPKKKETKAIPPTMMNVLHHHGTMPTSGRMVRSEFLRRNRVVVMTRHRPARIREMTKWRTSQVYGETWDSNTKSATRSWEVVGLEKYEIVMIKRLGRYMWSKPSSSRVKMTPPRSILFGMKYCSFTRHITRTLSNSGTCSRMISTFTL